MKATIGFIIALFGLTPIWSQPLGWSNYQPIAVTENSGSNVYNYQLKIQFDSQSLINLGLMQASGDDLRFGSLCDQANLNYWIESGINTPLTTVWVRIDTLLSNQTENIFMFYGNPSAISASAIPGVFFGPHSSTDSVASGGAGGVTNSQRGFRFSANEDVLVTAFGKREPNGTTRYVTLFDFATQVILQQIQVSGPAAQYSYSNIPSPIWLTQGTQYLLELYQGTSDGYYFGSSSQIGQHLTYLDMRYCNSCTQNTFPTNTLSNIHYGYPDLWYWTKTTVTPAPTYNFPAPISVNLGPDDAFCGSVVLDAGSPGNLYVWNTGDSTQTLTVDTSGTYNVMLITNQNCVAFDTISVVINALPSINLGPDSAFCDQTTLDAGINTVSYLWNTTDTTQTIVVTSSGEYSVQIESVEGCFNSDTVDITIHTSPAVSFALPSDSVCINYSPFVLNTGTPAGGIYSGTGVSAGNFDPGIGTGNYSITYSYTDLNGCSNSDNDNIIVSGCLGLEGEYNVQLKVYPNPNNGNFYVETSLTGPNGYLQVFDMLGKIIYVSPLISNLQQVQLTVEKGTYFLQLVTDKGLTKQKLIIQ